MCTWNFKSEIDCVITLEVKITCGGVTQSTTQNVWPGNCSNPHNMYVDLNGLFCNCSVSTCTIEIYNNGILIYKSVPPGSITVKKEVCCDPNPANRCSHNNCAFILFSCVTKEVWLKRPLDCLPC